MISKNLVIGLVVAVFAIAILDAANMLPITSKPTTGAASASFAKPPEVVEWSNGFPSGEHYNLNIHGKKPSFNCDPTPGGSSVFVPEYGQSEIQYIQNKKASITSMYVIDPCSFSSNDPAKIQLPSGEYQVYARILAKPGKKNDDDRYVIFYPKLIDACDDTGEVDFGEFIDCSQSTYLGIGKVTKDGVFDKESEELIRIAPSKGKNKAKNITDLFQWTGYVCDPVYDTDGDGEITENDVQNDLDGDGVIGDADDLALYLELYCSYFEHEWIFNIADLVIYGWEYNNQGSKLLQVRFYPTDTAEFV